MRNLVWILGAAGFCIAVASCATMQPKIANTPSGLPEATFDNTSPSAVLDKIAARCMDRGLLVENRDAGEVTCRKKLSGRDSFLATLAAGLASGNANSTPPIELVRFVVIQIGPDVRVQAHAWLQTQTEFGQINTIEMKDNRHFNDLQGNLYSLGGHGPVSDAYQAYARGVAEKNRAAKAQAAAAAQ